MQVMWINCYRVLDKKKREENTKGNFVKINTVIQFIYNPFRYGFSLRL